MKNILPQQIWKILAILGVVAVVVILAFAYTNMFKNLKAKPGQEKPTTAAQPVPVEAQIGTVMDVSVQPDGTVQITVDEKTYLLPSDQTVKLYTNATQTTSIPASQLKKEMIVNVIKFSNPQSYVIVGVTDKKFVDKLL